MRHIVAGYLGEVGSAIFNILKEYYDVEGTDQRVGVKLGKEYSVLHITFGYKDNEVDNFKNWAREYQAKFLKEGGLTIVHSTTAVGVCDDLGVVHSPIVGSHYQMEEYIRKATKIFGGKRAMEAAEIFRRIGMKVLVYEKAAESELAKLLLTECYRVNIEFCQRAKRLSDKLGLNFNETYTLPSKIYNEIYTLMGHEEYVRQVLAPNTQEISGHCVVPNSKLIKLSE